MSDQANPVRFCISCGAVMPPGARFCNQCGATNDPVAPSAPVAPPPPVYAPPPPVYAPPVQYNQPPYAVQRPAPVKKSKLPLILILIIVAVLVIAGGIATFILLGGGKPQPTSNTAKPSQETSGTSAEVTVITTDIIPAYSDLVISDGVSPDDLGNNYAGQFFYLRGDYVYYTSFDTTPSAHLYRMNASDGTLDMLFDGFAWYVVVAGDWIYFSGNEGPLATDDYNIYRVAIDGSGFEQLNNKDCFSLNVVGDKLYYGGYDPADETKYQLYRSDLDGSHEETILDEFYGSYTIYNDQLIYNDTANKLYSADLDGHDQLEVLSDAVSFFVGQGRLVYTNEAGDVRIADLDGGNDTLIRPFGGTYVASLNSYGDKLFMTFMSETLNTENNAYPYDLYSMDFDGSNEMLLFSGESQGTYINLVDDHIVFIEYVMDAASSNMAAILYACNLDGSDIREMPR